MVDHCANCGNAADIAVEQEHSSRVSEDNPVGTTFQAALQSGQIVVTGQRQKPGELPGMLETFTLGFPTVEPRPAL